MVRDQIGPIACYGKPRGQAPAKTRSGKILRGTCGHCAGKEYRAPSTIDDPTILEEITDDLKSWAILLMASQNSPTAALRCILRHCGVPYVRLIPQDLRACSCGFLLSHTLWRLLGYRD